MLQCFDLPPRRPGIVASAARPSIAGQVARRVFALAAAVAIEAHFYQLGRAVVETLAVGPVGRRFCSRLRQPCQGDWIRCPGGLPAGRGGVGVTWLEGAAGHRLVDHINRRPPVFCFPGVSPALAGIGQVGWHFTRSHPMGWVVVAAVVA